MAACASHTLTPSLSAPQVNIFSIGGAHEDLGGFPGASAVNGSLWSPHLSCVWHSLYTPTTLLAAAVQDEYDGHLHAGRLGPEGKFTAIHLRGGNLVGERENVVRGNPLYNLLDALNLARGFGLPVFLAASDSRVRSAVATGVLVGVAGPSEAEAVHSGVRDFNHLRTFVELGMLARGACGIWTPSGFGAIARWWSEHHDCQGWVGPPWP